MDWLRAAFSLFRRQPGLLMTVVVANLFAMMLLSLVPVAGPLLAVLLIPAFGMALMQSCALAMRGERATAAVLLTGFRQPAVQRLCKLGLVYLGLFAFITLLTRVSVSPEFLAAMTQPVDPRKPPVFAPSDMLTMLGISTLQLLAFLALSFATPLCYWKEMGAFKAVFYSVFAVRSAWRAFLAMMLAFLGLFFGLAMVLMLVFGNSQMGQVVILWLILMFGLLQQCAIYAAYHQMFEAPDAAPV
jgi:hypothetical protein